MKLQHIVLVLLDRWRIALGVFGATVIAAILLNLVLPNQYTSTASIVVDAKPDPITGATGMAALALQAYVTTQADVISSERVAQRVVKVLKLDSMPELQKRWRKSTNGVGDISIWLADYLLAKKLAVTPGHDNPAQPSNVIDISVKWSDPKTAAALANTFAQVAIETNIELKVEPARQYAAWFVKRSHDLRVDLEAKQKRLTDFQKAAGIVATDEKLDVENERLNQLSTALVAVQNERQDSQSRQRQVSSAGSNDSLPEVLQNPLIGSLKNSLSDAEAKETDVAARLGKNHPDYQAAAATVAALRARIAQETQKIASSLGSTVRADQQRESELRQAVELQKKRVLDLKYQHDVLRLVRQLAKSRGLSVVITLHDFNHAALYADRLAMIAETKLAAVGSPAQVITAELIHHVYGVEVTIVPHPVYQIPMVVPMIVGDRVQEVP